MLAEESSDAPDDEELAFCISRRRSRVDMGGSSSSASSPVVDEADPRPTASALRGLQLRRSVAIPAPLPSLVQSTIGSSPWS